MTVGPVTIENGAEQASESPLEPETEVRRHRPASESDEGTERTQPQRRTTRFAQFAELQRQATLEHDDGDREGNQRKQESVHRRIRLRR